MIKKLLMLLILGLMVCGAEGKAWAIITAADGGWTITVDPEMGLYEWIDPFGVNHIYQEWWWFGPSEYYEVPLGAFKLEDESNPDGNADQILLEYSEELGSYFELFYDLDAAGSSASIFERLTFAPGEELFEEFGDFGEPIDIRIFEYTDFDLAWTLDDDSAFGDTSGITQSDGSQPVIAKVVPISPSPSHFEIAEFDEILDALDDEYPTTLSDTESPFGPGDATFAFQWDFTLAPDGIYTIEKRKEITIVPEPASLLLLGLGLLGFAGRGINKNIKYQKLKIKNQIAK